MNGIVLVSFDQTVLEAACPEHWRDTAKDHGVRPRVQEIVPETGEVVSSYDMSEERGIGPDLDRLESHARLGEEPADVPSGENRNGTTYGGV